MITLVFTVCLMASDCPWLSGVIAVPRQHDAASDVRVLFTWRF